MLRGAGFEIREAAQPPMTLRDGRLYIPWPPHGGVEGYWVLERKGNHKPADD